MVILFIVILFLFLCCHCIIFICYIYILLFAILLLLYHIVLFPFYLSSFNLYFLLFVCFNIIVLLHCNVYHHKVICLMLTCLTIGSFSIFVNTFVKFFLISIQTTLWRWWHCRQDMHAHILCYEYLSSEICALCIWNICSKD